MNTRRKQLAAAAAVCTVAATLHTLGGIVAAEVVNREEPTLFAARRKKTNADRRFKKPSAQRQAADAAAARLRDCKDTVPVEIIARDGTLLVGHWRACPEPKRVLLAFHGWRSTWNRDFGAISDFWYRTGCDVLYVEQRAHGESGGTAMGYGLVERYDCLDWLRWLDDSGAAGDRPIYLAGLSMGATTVLLAAGMTDTLPDTLHGMIADCGFTSPAAIWKHVAETRWHLPYALCRRPLERRFYRTLCFRADEASTVEAMRRCTLPTLLIHGLADRFVPPSMTLENYAACAAPKWLLLVPGAAHGMSYLTDPKRYEALCRAFWQRFD